MLRSSTWTFLTAFLGAKVCATSLHMQYSIHCACTTVLTQLLRMMVVTSTLQYSAEAIDDFLAQVTSCDAPNHELHLKVGAVCSIMWNLSSVKGLVRNQQVVITSTKPQYIEVKSLNCGHHPDVTHCIPQIIFDFWPPYVSYTMQRKQFPLQLAYSTTFNSCQGLTFDRVAIDGHTDVFAHGQLYTAISRVCTRQDAWVYMPENRLDIANVVYPKLLMHI